MSDVTQEMKGNLCKIGEPALADQIDNIPSAEWLRVLEYTRYLVAIHGSKEALHRKVHSEIISHLWGHAVSCDDGSYLRLRILVLIERMVRECQDITDIEVELITLAATWEVSFLSVANLHELSQLVALGDFKALRQSLPPTNISTKSYVQVLGKARHYFKTGDMVGVDYAAVVKEVEL